MKKMMTILLAVLLLTAMLSFTAMADDTVTQTTDENGNPVTIITDEDGNQTIIRQVEPGEDDITFDEDDLDLEDLEDPEDGEAATSDAESNIKVDPDASTGLPTWVLPVVIASAAVAVVLLARLLRKKK